MKRPSFFRRLIEKFRGGKEAPKPQPASATPPAGDKKPVKRNTSSSFEPLEGRIAPAVLVNASTIQFTDTDGDLVTVQFSKSIFVDTNPLDPTILEDTLDDVFVFLDGDNVRTADRGGVASDADVLAMLDLSALAPIAAANIAEGTSITITAEPQNGMGDGLVNIGHIKAATSSLFGISLGNVVVDGDLGQIDAGNRNKSVGIASLTVNSWGTQGTDTQLTTPSLESNVTSGIGTLTVLGNFQDATLKVIDGSSSTKNAGKIGTLTIGGNLFGTSTDTEDDAGLISTSGDISKITVTNIIGGGGENSGKITTLGKIGSLTITADMRGGSGDDSGQVVAAKGFGTITLRDLWGGTGENSGRILSDASISSITLRSISGHHTFSGDATADSAATIATGGTISKATITGNISGGAGDGSGTITAGTMLSKITVGGHLIGGAGAGSGQIIGGDNISNVLILGGTQTYTAVINANGAPGVQEVQAMDLGDVFGVPGSFKLTYTLADGTTQTTTELSSDATAAQITAALVALPAIGADGVTVAKQGGRIAITFAAEGDQTGLFTATAAQAGIVGSTGSASGGILSNGAIGKVTVNAPLATLPALQSGAGSQSGSIAAVGNIGTIVLHGDLDGSKTDIANAGASITAGGNLKSLTINGSLRGGDGEFTGAVSADGTIGTVKVFGSLIGAGGDASASIVAGGKFGSAFVAGSLDGGSGASSAALVAGSDFTLPGDFGKVVVKGQLLGDGQDSASIRAGGKLNSVTVGTLSSPTLTDVLVGGSGSGSASIVGNRGANSITVLGNILGGGGDYSATVQTFGKLSSLKVSGDVTGGVGESSASIFARDLVAPLTITPGDLGKISIGGEVQGDVGEASAQIKADGSIKSVTLGALTGGQGVWSASIVSGTGDSAFFDEFKTIGGIGTIKINGAVTREVGEFGASIQAGARISSLTVNGNVSGSTLQTGRDFGSITIVGNLFDSQITALGSAKASTKADVAIGKLSVTGSVEQSLIRAGYDLFGNAANGNAQIGSVKVGVDWIASSLAAGVEDVAADGFGNEDDEVIDGGTISKIASIVIGGVVTGSPADGDQFGFVAQTIGSVKIGGVKQLLDSDKNTIDLAGTPTTDDTSIREVA